MYNHSLTGSLKNKYLPVLLALLCAASCRAPKDLVYQNIQNFSVKQAGMDKTTVAMDIRLYNPNKYTLKLKHADVDVFINNSLVGKLNAARQCTLSARDTVSLPVTLDVDMKKILPNALQLLFNSEVDVKLVGKIKAGRHGVYINAPVNYEGKQDILSGIR